MSDNYQDINEATFGGRLAFDPDSRSTAGGKTMVTTKIPVSEKYNGKEKTLWVRVVAFGAAAEQVMRFRKGDKVKVRGKVSLNEWTNRDNEKRTDLECMAWEMVGANEFFATRERRDAPPRSEPQRQGHRPRQEEQRWPPPNNERQDDFGGGADDEPIPF